MPIDTSLLVAAAMLQDYLVDKDTGGPLAGGIVTLYEDTQRQTLKNWYYLTGIPTAYTWTALDNPMILSSVGTIQDPQGNDVIPYYYPFDENDSTISQKYYITVTNYNGVPQWTRENFPPSGSGSGPSPTITTSILNNLILNDEYYRNAGDSFSGGNIDVTNVLNKIVSPSQHENFNILQNAPTGSTAELPASTDPIYYGDSDVRFMQDVVGDATTVSFVSMAGFSLSSTSPTLTQTPVPEYALDINCTVAGDATKKFIQYPIATHLAALSNQQFTYVIWFYSPGGGTNNQVIITLYSSLGSGTVGGSPSMSPSYLETTLATKNITASGSMFQLVTGTGTFPNTSLLGLTLGDGADDANYLRIYFPVGSEGVMRLRHTKPQIYLTNNIIPTNEFQPYDYLNALMNSPRTGDLRLSSNAYYNFGWVPMTNGTIGFTGSNATVLANADAWQLYSLLWNMNQYNQGYAPLYTSAGGWKLYGASAYADFASNMALGLPRALGSVLAGTTPVVETGQAFTTDHGTSATVLTVTNSSAWGNGTPVYLYNTGGALPTGLKINTIYYVVFIPGNTDTTKITLATYYNASFNTIPNNYFEFTQRPNVKITSLANMTATYSNGTAGVGATLTITTANFTGGMDTGYTPVLHDRLLIKNQATTFQNGIYQVTTVGVGVTDWVLTRTVDADSSATFQYLTYVYTDTGGTNGGLSFYLVNNVYTVGTDAVSYTQLSFTLASFSDNGSGTNYIQAYGFPDGYYEGQRFHQLIQQELPDPVTSHAYGNLVDNGSVFDAISNSAVYGAGADTISNQGGNIPHNNMQPTLYQNFYIKL